MKRRSQVAVLAALSFVLLAGSAAAQDRSSPGFLDNLFKRDQQPAQQQDQGAPDAAQNLPSGPVSSNEVGTRIDRIENALRQLTGTIEELQHQNQMLQTQLKRMQDDTEYRFQQLGAKAAPAPPAANGMAPRAMAPQAPTVQPMSAPANVPQGNGRSDAFDPALHPNAPGAPRALGTGAIMTPENTNAANLPPVGAPGGRTAGAPLDLTSLSGNPNPPPTMPVPNATQMPVAGQQPTAGQQPQPPQRGPAGPGVQLATLPPSASPKDEYELAYGYVLHKDYGLAEQAFRDFIRKYPNEKLTADAQYWLGESQFQQQRYRDAAEAFLAVSTKHESAGKAPDALLRLGQSLAALHQKEAACATLAEVGRKFPHASASVKRGVAQEQKRTHC